MGATLPILSKFVSREENFIGKDVGTLYSINTFGAVVGAWASAFFFMRLFGVKATIGIAAAVNISIALIIYFLFKPPLKARLPYLETSSKKSGTSLQSSEIFILLSFVVEILTYLHLSFFFFN